MADQLTIFDKQPAPGTRPYRVTPQWSRVLNYLQRHGSITPAEAREQLGVDRLAARIPEIVALGYKVESTRATVLNRFNQPIKVARYVYKGREGGGA